MAKRTLSEIEKFFIEKNMEKGVEWLTEHIGAASHNVVSAYYEQVKERPVDSFARQDGVIMMTPAQSERDDIKPHVEQPAPTHIHKIK